ncbi:Thioredoxin domain-containing protein [Persephonella hydrogeniphila]|uniref:Thioredoxin domain-containing protein n=1 Tax=Persephonella hydrogeniphila TaxID=198703 RepID=A0A285NI36_9AQUI|nr:thioredoxin family protein [Persephonella hydrogeniphila]SNZ08573.1 Thioredoxin domain-containing protein [Persephonella hydrogeniphila]
MEKVIIEILDSEGCAKCVGLRERLYTVLNQLGYDNIEVRHLDLFEDQERIVELGIYTSPALAVNGRVYFLGIVPSEKSLKEVITDNIGD